MATTKITINGVTKDIHDKRLPKELGEAGQVLKVNEDGTEIVWGNGGGGGGDAKSAFIHNITMDVILMGQIAGTMMFKMFTGFDTPLTPANIVSVMNDYIISKLAMPHSGYAYGNLAPMYDVAIPFDGKVLIQLQTMMNEDPDPYKFMYIETGNSLQINDTVLRDLVPLEDLTWIVKFNDSTEELFLVGTLRSYDDQAQMIVNIETFGLPLNNDTLSVNNIIHFVDIVKPVSWEQEIL